MIHVLVLARVNLFSLQRFDEALATGIVVRVGWPAHARDHAVLFSGSQRALPTRPECPDRSGVPDLAMVFVSRWPFPVLRSQAGSPEYGPASNLQPCVKSRRESALANQLVSVLGVTPRDLPSSK